MNTAANTSHHSARSPRWILVTPWLVLAAACGSDDADAEASSAPLQAAIDAIVERGAPGVIASSRSGSQISTVTSGVRDLATGEPITEDDRFRGGSTSKPLLAAVVLQLAEEQVLSLDD